MEVVIPSPRKSAPKEAEGDAKSKAKAKADAPALPKSKRDTKGLEKKAKASSETTDAQKAAAAKKKAKADKEPAQGPAEDKANLDANDAEAKANAQRTAQDEAQRAAHERAKAAQDEAKAKANAQKDAQPGPSMQPTPPGAPASSSKRSAPPDDPATGPPAKLPKLSIEPWASDASGRVVAPPEDFVPSGYQLRIVNSIVKMSTDMVPALAVPPVHMAVEGLVKAWPAYYTLPAPVVPWVNYWAAYGVPRMK